MKRAPRIVASLAILAAGLVTMPISQAEAAVARTVQAYPNHGLVDGEPIIVRWSAFPKSQWVYVLLCEGGAKTADRCAKFGGGRPSDATSAFAQTSSAGKGSKNLTVIVSDGNHGLAGVADVQCDAAHPCDVVVSESATSLAGSARAAIRFAPVVACPDPGLLSAVGSGSDAAELAMGVWSSQLCKSPNDIALGYSAKNDVSGRSDYQCLKVDFAVVEYLPDYENDTCPPTTPGGKDTKRPVTRLAPISVSPVVIAFNMFNQSATDTNRIDHLVLTPDLLAEIFTGRLYTGQDKRIKALNPGVTLPVNIKAIARADQSGINYTLTRFLNAASPDAYKAGGRLFQSGPTDSLANVNGLDLRTGGTAVAKAVLYPENDPLTTAWGYLGVMDASQAARYGLSTVTLKLGSGAGARSLAPTDAATLASLSGITANRYGYFDIPALPKDANAWPMVSVAYAIPPAADAPAARRIAAQEAISYIIDPARGQSRDLLPAGYVPLPKALADVAKKAVALAAPDPEPSATADPAGSVSPSVGPITNPTAQPTANPNATANTTLASVFDRSFNTSGATSWVWLLMLLGAAGAVVFLIRTTNGATK